MQHAATVTGLFVQEAGSGDPLVFLHALGASSRYFAPRLGLLPEHARCVLPDLLGFGLSPKPLDSAYAVADHIAAIRTALEEAGVKTFVLCGHSLGAILAVEYAAAYPESVTGLVLFGLPYYRSQQEALMYIGRQGGLFSRAVVANGRVAWLICMALHARPRLSERLAVLGSRWWGLPPEVAADAVRHRWESYSRTLARCILAHDLTPALARLRVPRILALHGEQDPAAPLDAVRGLAAGRTDFGLRTLPGGHHLWLTANDQCIAAVSAYLQEVGRA